MMRWIVGSSLKLRYMVLAIAVAVMFFGIIRLRDTPVDVFPEFAPPYVEIQTEALGLSAAEVEQLVTVPMEELFNGVPLSWQVYDVRRQLDRWQDSRAVRELDEQLRLAS